MFFVDFWRRRVFPPVCLKCRVGRLLGPMRWLLGGWSGVLRALLWRHSTGAGGNGNSPHLGHLGVLVRGLEVVDGVDDGPAKQDPRGKRRLRNCEEGALLRDLPSDGAQGCWARLKRLVQQRRDRMPYSIVLAMLAATTAAGKPNCRGATHT